jgi:hypothetical protein
MEPPILSLPSTCSYRFVPHPRFTHDGLGVGRWCIVSTPSTLARKSGTYALGCGGRRSRPHGARALAAPTRFIHWRCVRAWSRYDSAFPLTPLLRVIRAATEPRLLDVRGWTK